MFNAACFLCCCPFLLSLFFRGGWNVLREGVPLRGNGEMGVVLFMIDRSQPQGPVNLIPVPVFLDLGERYQTTDHNQREVSTGM
jgi:hypothetical protein